MKIKRSKSDVLSVLDTALVKIVRSEFQPLTAHDRQWAKAIRHWLAGADDEEAVRLVLEEQAANEARLRAAREQQ